MRDLRRLATESFFPIRSHGARRELDGIRGIAILIVFLGHILLFDPKLPQFIGSFGQVGVYLFFVLSAFLLTDIMIKESAAYPWKSVVLAFIVRRVLRIFPMYYFSLMLLNIFPQFAHMMFGGRMFSNLRHFLLIYPEGNYWAISVELEFYLMVPLFTAFVLSAKKIGKMPVVLFLICTALFFSRLVAYFLVFPLNFPHILPYINVFVFGVLTASINYYFGARIKMWPRSLMFLCSVISISMFIILLPGIGINLLGFEWIFTANYSSYAGFAAFLLLFSAIFGSNSITKIYSSNFLGFVGSISFSIYMLHVFVMSFFAGNLYVKYGIVAAAVIVFALTSALSAFTFLLVERPFIKLGSIISKLVHSWE